MSKTKRKRYTGAWLGLAGLFRERLLPVLLASRCAVGNSVECDFNRPTVKGQVTRGVAGDVWLGA